MMHRNDIALRLAQVRQQAASVESMRNVDVLALISNGLGQVATTLWEYAGVLEADLAASPNVTPEMNPVLREFLGKLVRKEWVDWAHEQPCPKDTWLRTWNLLPEWEKEIDRRLGVAVWNFSYIREVQVPDSSVPLNIVQAANDSI